MTYPRLRFAADGDGTDLVKALTALQGWQVRLDLTADTPSPSGTLANVYHAARSARTFIVLTQPDDGNHYPPGQYPQVYETDEVRTVVIL